MSNPDISVIITCYNLGRYLDEAVNSVWAQTMQDFEVIIVNDGSTDAFTKTLLKSYTHPKIKVFTIDNRGPAGARNFGITKARAPFVIPLDADDYFEPTCLQKASQILKEMPDVGIANFWYRTFGDQEGLCAPESCTLEETSVENRICGNCMIRKSAWEKVGGYDEGLKGYEDWELWINILAHGYRCHVIKEVLFNYRVRGDSRVQKDNLPENRAISMKLIVEKHREIFQKNAIHVILGKDSLIGDLSERVRMQDQTLKSQARLADEADRVIQKQSVALAEMNRLQQSIVHSPSYRLGRILTSPYRKIRDLKRFVKRLG